MDIILLLGSLQAFFLTALLVSKKNRGSADIILAVWLGHIGLHLLILFLALRTTVPPLLLNLNAVLPLLQGPYLYLYVTALVRPEPPFDRQRLVHLIPGILYVILVVVALPGLRHGDVVLPIITAVITITISISVPLYVALSLLQIRTHNQRLQSFLSSTGGVDLAWLRTILVGMCILWAVVIAVNVLYYLQPVETRHASSHAIFLVLTLFIYAIGYLGIRQKQIFADLPPAPVSVKETVVEQKYERSGLSEERAQQISQELTVLMQTEKPFLQESLSLQWLAERLTVPANHLSQVINQQSGTNFHDFVNGFRIREFLERRRDPAAQNLTLLAIALDSGFQSKASFNRAFKRQMGCPPSQYTDS